MCIHKSFFKEKLNDWIWAFLTETEVSAFFGKNVKSVLAFPIFPALKREKEKLHAYHWSI